MDARRDPGREGESPPVRVWLVDLGPPLLAGDPEPDELPLRGGTTVMVLCAIEPRFWLEAKGETKVIPPPPPLLLLLADPKAPLGETLGETVWSDEGVAARTRELRRSEPGMGKDEEGRGLIEGSAAGAEGAKGFVKNDMGGVGEGVDVSGVAVRPLGRALAQEIAVRRRLLRRLAVSRRRGEARGARWKGRSLEGWSSAAGRGLDGRAGWWERVRTEH